MTAYYNNHLGAGVSLLIKPESNSGNDAVFQIDSKEGTSPYISCTVVTSDTQAPSVPTNVTATAQSQTSILVGWTASTDNVGVTGYKVFRNGGQVGTSATTSYTDTGLSQSTTYSYTVSAYDAAGNNSAQSSPAATAKTMAAISISSAKLLGDTSTVGLTDKIVTAVFSDHFYVEESNRNSGVKVVPTVMPAGIAAGKTVDIGGTMQTGSDGERYIGSATATLKGTGSVAALGMNNKAIGGGDWYYDSGSGAGQKGIKDASGANNIGLLVLIWGKVTYAGSDYYYLDDGSALDDGSGQIGVKVLALGTTVPAVDSYKTVTGISSCYKVGSDLFRLVRARS